MAGIESAFSPFTGLGVEPYKRAGRVCIVSDGASYSIAAVTGTIAAALGANSSVFAMRLDPGAGVVALLQRIRLAYTTIVAFTTPVTAGRRLALFRGSGAAASGGSGLTVALAKDTALDPLSEFNNAQGGDMRIATTGALTVTGITFEADPFRVMTLTHVGAAGAFYDKIFEFSASDVGGPIVLQPGQLLAVRNPVAMDAAGTWQLGVEVDWSEKSTNAL